MRKETLKQLSIKLLMGFVIIFLINRMFGLEFKLPTYIAYMIIGPIFIAILENRKKVSNF